MVHTLARPSLSISARHAHSSLNNPELSRWLGAPAPLAPAVAVGHLIGVVNSTARTFLPPPQVGLVEFTTPTVSSGARDGFADLSGGAVWAVEDVGR
jgi:hypothetical protein